MKGAPMTWSGKFVVAAASALVLVSCASADSPTTVGVGVDAAVTIDGFAFEPATLVVAPGTTVTWTNTQKVNHTITLDDGSASSDNVAEGGTFSFTFLTPGTYEYHCAIHPNMTGSITVDG